MTNINIFNVLSTALINTTQNLEQYSKASQIVGLDCTNKKFCLKCLKKYKDEKLCSEFCQCDLKNINMKQIINIDFTILDKTDSIKNFKTNFFNSLYKESNTKGIKISKTEKDTKEIGSKLEQFITKIQGDTTIQDSFQDISNTQVVIFKGPGIISNLTMEQMVKKFSKIIKQISSLKNISVELSSLITKITTQQMRGGLEQLIERLIQILVIIVLGVTFLYSTQLFFTLYGLITRT